jgi:ribosome-associated protein
MVDITAEKETSSEELCNLVVKGMQEKKALDIVVMDLRGVKMPLLIFCSVCRYVRYSN